MKRRTLYFVTLLLALVLPVYSALDAQTVSNVRLQQLTTGTHPFEVLYDLTGAPAGGAAVSVAFGTSSSGPFNIIPAANELSGDVGSAVTNGTSKRIVWSAAPGLCSTLYAAVSVSVCSFTLNPASASYGASGGTGQFTITASGGSCAWTATSNASWLTITSGASGTGSGTVGYSVAVNSGAARTGTITAGGQTFTVNQAEASAAPQEITITLPGNVPLVLVKIPAGTFQMGSPDSERGRSNFEGPVHQVTLTKDYYMGKYEVTEGQWQAVMGTTPTWCGTFPMRAYRSVSCVGWNEVAGAGGFFEKLNAHLSETGQIGAGNYKLPTEAQWERAARAGTQTRFSFGDALSGDDGYECRSNYEASQYVWWCNNSASISEVGAKSPNGYGLFDMHGNVNEWVNDWADYYTSGAQSDPTGPASGGRRVLRGGGYNNELIFCRSATRLTEKVDARFRNIGFRVSMLP